MRQWEPRQSAEIKLRGLPLAFLLVALCAAAGWTKPKHDEGLRSQLTSLQKETGLSLSYFGWYIGTLDFAHKSKLLSAQHLPRPAGNSQNGDLSPQGDMIAFAWSYGTPLAPGPSPNADPSVTRLAIVRRDGSGLEEFPAVRQPDRFCWSPDQTKLIVYSRVQSKGAAPGAKVYLIDLGSKTVEEILADPVLLTTQCWSPDGKQIVYAIPAQAAETPGTVVIYDFSTRQVRTLTHGTYPTWSPDGGRIAFLEGKNYYVIQPGAERKLLFYSPNAKTGVLWSPDSRFVAYGVCCHYSAESTLVRFYVRRLRDNAEDWVADVGDVPHAIDVHWIAPARSRSRF